MTQFNRKIPAIMRINLGIAVGVALGLSYNNLSVGIAVGFIVGLLTPAKHLAACLLDPEGGFSVRRTAVAAGALAFVSCLSIFVATYVAGFTGGFLHGLFS